jgi:hypothetical protein
VQHQLQGGQKSHLHDLDHKQSEGVLIHPTRNLLVSTIDESSHDLEQSEKHSLPTIQRQHSHDLQSKRGAGDSIHPKEI